eukprot:1160117-Pelagomonas_calceolata.AAC.12
MVSAPNHLQHLRYLWTCSACSARWYWLPAPAASAPASREGWSQHLQHMHVQDEAAACRTCTRRMEPAPAAQRKMESAPNHLQRLHYTSLWAYAAQHTVSLCHKQCFPRLAVVERMMGMAASARTTSPTY